MVSVADIDLHGRQMPTHRRGVTMFICIHMHVYIYIYRYSYILAFLISWSRLRISICMGVRCLHTEGVSPCLYVYICMCIYRYRSSYILASGNPYV